MCCENVCDCMFVCVHVKGGGRGKVERRKEERWRDRQTDAVYYIVSGGFVLTF